MTELLSQYLVMQQNVWGVRRVFTARSRANGQVQYLMEEPVHTGVRGPGLPMPPRMKLLSDTGKSRWLVGAIPEGDSLEDLYREGSLTEADVIDALRGVLDDLQALLLLVPPMVPGYLDPACIKRAPNGAWLVDYLALAHAPEARVTGGLPLGVHPFGVLLYWLATGEKVRRARIQPEQLGRNFPAALQYFLVACLNRSFPSLAEVHMELERAAADGHFHPLVRMVGKRAAQVRAARLNAAPAGDPWDAWVAEQQPPPPPVAQPMAQAERSYSPPVSTPPRPQVPPTSPLHYHKVALGGTYIPANDRPWSAAPRPSGGYKRVVAPVRTSPTAPRVLHSLRLGKAVMGVSMMLLAAALQLNLIPTEYMPLFSAEKYVAPELETAGQPTPSGPTVGSTEDLDQRSGGIRVAIYVDGETVGHAYAFPHSRFPFISVAAFNELFGRRLQWSVHDAVTVRIETEEDSFLTDDYQIVEGRLWLRMTPDLQERLGVRLQAATWEAFHFRYGN